MLYYEIMLYQKHLWTGCYCEVRQPWRILPSHLELCQKLRDVAQNMHAPREVTKLETATIATLSGTSSKPDTVSSGKATELSPSTKCSTST